jgi:hypothetical protein
VICDINQSRYATLTLSMRDFVRRLAANPKIVSDSVVAESEYQHRARNAAMAYLMQAFGNLPQRCRRGAAQLLPPLRAVDELRRRGAWFRLPGQQRLLPQQRRAGAERTPGAAGERDHGHQRAV